MLRNRTPTATLGVPKPPPFEPAAATKRFSSLKLGGSPPPPPEPAEEPWEVRPCGMLVQKRDSASDASVKPPPPIRVRVKFGAVCHEIRISPEASFGELKKMLSVETGLHPQDMKLLFKDRERDGTAFLDNCGVKDRSKVVLVEDPSGQAKRFLEMRKNAKMEKAVKTINQISVEVDKLAGQVTQLETIISKGKKVAESGVLDLIEKLMDLLIKLDEIVADGDVKVQRRVQVRRVQKYVETLDLLKIKNSMSTENVQQQQQQQKQYQFPYSEQQTVKQKPAPQPSVVTTRWEPFDLLSSMPSASSSSSSTTTASVPSAPASHTPTAPPRFNWELF